MPEASRQLPLAVRFELHVLPQRDARHTLIAAAQLAAVTALARTAATKAPRD